VFTVSQDGSDVTLSVTSPQTVVASFSTRFGTVRFDGEVDGDDVELAEAGTARIVVGSCDFTFEGKIIASQDGDTMKGRIEYRAQDNNGDCGTRDGCVSKQTFTGARLTASP
jgi:hypothetical protein